MEEVAAQVANCTAGENQYAAITATATTTTTAAAATITITTSTFSTTTTDIEMYYSKLCRKCCKLCPARKLTW